MAVKQVSSSKGKAASKAPSKESVKKESSAKIKVVDKDVSSEKNKNSAVAGWVQDVSLEVPNAPGSQNYSSGQRELEFSVGMRQQELDGVVRSELRARALVHAEGVMLALVEASYVCDMAQEEMSESLPHDMYGLLKPHLEALLHMGGHTPPLPASLKQVEA